MTGIVANFSITKLINCDYIVAFKVKFNQLVNGQIFNFFFQKLILRNLSDKLYRYNSILYSFSYSKRRGNPWINNGAVVSRFYLYSMCVFRIGVVTVNVQRLGDHVCMDNEVNVHSSSKVFTHRTDSDSTWPSVPLQVSAFSFFLATNMDNYSTYPWLPIIFTCFI